MNKIKTNQIFKSAEIRTFKSFPTFTKIKGIMSYTREDALKLNDEKIKIEKVSFILDFDILLVQKVNEKFA